MLIGMESQQRFLHLEVMVISCALGTSLSLEFSINNKSSTREGREGVERIMKISAVGVEDG